MANYSNLISVVLGLLLVGALTSAAPLESNTTTTEQDASQPSLGTKIIAAANATAGVVGQGLQNWVQTLKSPEAVRAQQKLLEQTKGLFWSRNKKQDSSSSSDSSDSSSSSDSSDSSDSSNSGKHHGAGRPPLATATNGTNTTQVANATTDTSQPTMETEADEADANVNVGEEEAAAPAEGNNNETVNDNATTKVPAVNGTMDFGNGTLAKYTRSLAESFRIL